MSDYAFWKCVLKYRIPGQIEMASVYLYNTIPAIPPATFRSQFLTDDLGTPFSNCISVSATLYQWDIYGLDSNFEWQPVRTITQSRIGQRSGTQYPPQLAACVVARTQHKRTIGRKFISPLSANDWSAGEWIVTYTTVLQAFLDKYKQTKNDTFATYYPGLFDKNWNYWVFNSGYVSPVCGSNRRRVIGHGI